MPMCVFVGARRFPLQFDICQWPLAYDKQAKAAPKEDGHESMSIAQRYICNVHVPYICAYMLVTVAMSCC